MTKLNGNFLLGRRGKNETGQRETKDISEKHAPKETRLTSKKGGISLDTKHGFAYMS